MASALGGKAVMRYFIIKIYKHLERWLSGCQPKAGPPRAEKHLTKVCTMYTLFTVKN